MLPQGTTRVTGALSSYHASFDGDDFGEPGYEVLAMHGLSDKLELGGKFAYFDVGFGDDDMNIFHLMAIPKVSLIPDQLAVVVPVGLMTSDEDGANNVYQVIPGVVYSQQLNPDFEVDVTGHTLILINDEFDDTLHYFGANIGLQLSPGGAAWAIHPEFGLLIPVGDAAGEEGGGGGGLAPDYFFHFGFAFHYRFGGAQAAAPIAAE